MKNMKNKFSKLINISQLFFDGECTEKKIFEMAERIAGQTQIISEIFKKIDVISSRVSNISNREDNIEEWKSFVNETINKFEVKISTICKALEGQNLQIIKLKNEIKTSCTKGKNNA